MNKIYQKRTPDVKTTARSHFGGFTLIELLVVVLIIGILSAIALPKYQVAVDKARFAQLETATKALKTGLEIFWLENGEYPTDASMLSIQAPGGWTASGKNWTDEGGSFSCSFNDSLVYCAFLKPRMAEFVMGLDHAASSEHIGKTYCWVTSVEDGKKRGERLCKALGGQHSEGSFWLL